MKLTALTLSGAALALGFVVSVGVAQQSTSAETPTNVVKLTVKDTNRMPWEMFDIPQIKAKIPVKTLFHDPATGMTTLLVRYPAGFMNTWHTHPHAHGMYIIDGVLKTNEGEYGPGNFVWFPEGGWTEHGATAENDVTFLFITNKEFGINYTGDPKAPYPMSK